MLRFVFYGSPTGTTAGLFALVATGLLVVGCGSSAPTERPTTPAPPSVAVSTPGSGAPVPSGGSDADRAGPDSSGPESSGPAPAQHDSSGSGSSDAGPGPASSPLPTATEEAPTPTPKCVVFVTGPPAGEIGPATVHLRSTTPRTDVSVTVESGAGRQQLSTVTDDSGLAVQPLEPIAAGESEQVTVAVGPARCSATFPPR